MIPKSSLLIFFLLVVNILNGQSPKKDSVHTIVPRVSTIKSAIFPGLGQINNRQYWKLPIVYGGFATVGSIIRYNNRRYKKYRDYYYIVSPHADDPSYVPPKTTEVPYEDGTIRNLDINQLKRINDGFRRNRDLSIIGLAVIWGFNVIDANVSAHLKTFDVSDNISLQWEPDFHLNMNNFEYLAGLSISLKFKK